MKNGPEIVMLALCCFVLGGAWVGFVSQTVLRPRWTADAADKAVADHERRKTRLLRQAAAARCWTTGTIPAVLHGGPFDGLPTEAAADVETMIWRDPRTGVRALYRFAACSEAGRWVFRHVPPAKASKIADAV